MTFSSKSVLFVSASSQYATAGDVLGSLLEYNLPWSLVAWYKTSTSGCIIGKQGDLPAASGFALSSYSGGVIRFNLVNNNATADQVEGTTTAGGWNDGEWHHVVLTKNAGYTISGGAFHVYVDGEDQALVANYDALTGSIATTAALYVGARVLSASPRYFGGNLDEVAIYPKELSQAEVTWLFGNGLPPDLRHRRSPLGLRSWWRMGENAIASTIPDVGAPQNYSPLTTSIDLNNDTVNESVIFGRFDEIDFVEQPCTMGVWVKHTGSATKTLINKAWLPGVSDGFSLVQTSTHLYLYVQKKDSSQSGYTLWTKSTADGAWHLVLFTYPGSQVGGGKIYVDGVSGSGGIGAPGILTGSGGGLYVGYGQGVGNYFVGQLCHSFAYKTELSARQVEQLFAGGTPQDLSVVGPVDDLVHWCALGNGDAIGAGNMLDLSGLGNHGTFNNGESGDFLADVPAGSGGSPYPLTLMGAPTIEDDAPTGVTYESSYVNESESSLYREYSWVTDFDVDTWKYDSSYINESEEVAYHEYWFKPTYLSDPEVQVLVNYKMRAVDSDQTNPPRYITWVVQREPDFDGDFYETLGEPTPVGSMVPGSAVVVASWEE